MNDIDGLNSGDPGIALLADAVRDVTPRELALVHCGDLPGLGAGAQRLVLDVREHLHAVADTVEESLDTSGLRGGALHGIVWPRAHLGKDFTRWCIARAAQGVREGGTVWCAVRKSKGAAGVAEALNELVGPVEVRARSKGYRLLCALRREPRDAAWAAVLRARYTIADAELLPGLSLHSAPGVFSRRALDHGTAALLKYVAASVDTAPTHVIDLCTGVGPLALAAAVRWPATRVTAVDSNVLAVALARRNACAHGLSDRVVVLAGDGLPDPTGGPLAELALLNPPTHVDIEGLRALLTGLRRGLTPGARLLAVVSRAAQITAVLEGLGATVQTHAVGDGGAQGRYSVVDARLSGA